MLDKPFKEWPNDAGFDASIEQQTPLDLQIKGKFPSYAAGFLYRTGPGNHRFKDDKGKDFSVNHWFDGFSHNYKFELIENADGSCNVRYSSRRQVDELIENVKKTGKMTDISFGQKRDPCKSLFGKLMSTFERSLPLKPGLINMGVTIAPNVPGVASSDGEKSVVTNLVTYTDNSKIKTIDPETLEPIGVTDQTSLHPDLRGELSCAHNHFDAGDVYNFNLVLGPRPVYRIFKTSAETGKTMVLATLSGSDVKAAYIHSFFLTADYVVLAIWTSHLGAGGARVLWERNILDSINAFDSQAQVKWFVVDRRSGRGLVAKLSSPAAFSFHSVNAWEEKGEDGKTDILCDVVQYPNLDILHRFYYQNMISTGEGVSRYADGAREGVNPHLVRYKLKGIPEAGSKHGNIPKMTSEAEVILDILGPKIGDLPTTNPSFSTRKTRFVYSVVDRGLSSWVDGISKVDTETGGSRSGRSSSVPLGKRYSCPTRKVRKKMVESCCL